MPAPPRREDLVNVHVGDGEPAARLHPLEARSGFHPTGVSPRRTVDLGCGGTAAVDLTIQSNRTSAAVKSGRMAYRRLGQHRRRLTAPGGVGVAYCVVPSWHRRWQALSGGPPVEMTARLVGIFCCCSWNHFAGRGHAFCAGAAVHACAAWPMRVCRAHAHAQVRARAVHASVT